MKQDQERQAESTMTLEWASVNRSANETFVHQSVGGCVSNTSPLATQPVALGYGGFRGGSQARGRAGFCGGSRGRGSGVLIHHQSAQIHPHSRAESTNASTARSSQPTSLREATTMAWNDYIDRALRVKDMMLERDDPCQFPSAGSSNPSANRTSNYGFQAWKHFAKNAHHFDKLALEDYLANRDPNAKQPVIKDVFRPQTLVDGKRTAAGRAIIVHHDYGESTNMAADAASDYAMTATASSAARSATGSDGQHDAVDQHPVAVQSSRPLAIRASDPSGVASQTRNPQSPLPSQAPRALHQIGHSGLWAIHPRHQIRRALPRTHCGVPQTQRAVQTQRVQAQAQAAPAQQCAPAVSTPAQAYIQQVTRDISAPQAQGATTQVANAHRYHGSRVQQVHTAPPSAPSAHRAHPTVGRVRGVSNSTTALSIYDGFDVEVLGRLGLERQTLKDGGTDRQVPMCCQDQGSEKGSQDRDEGRSDLLIDFD